MKEKELMDDFLIARRGARTLVSLKFN